MLSVHAAESSSPAAPAAQRLEPILVTSIASRAEEQLDATPAAVSVITREDMDRGVTHSLRDLLRYEPGVSIENGATRFGLGNINIRGLDGNRLQMLYDGVRLPDNFKVGSFSNANRNAVDPGLLSRVEILRGPSSALYGSDALAGVIAFTSVEPRDVVAKTQRFGGSVAAGYASADRNTQRGGVFAAREAGWEALLGYQRGDGSETQNRGAGTSIGSARTAPNPQHQRSENWLAKIILPTQTAGRFRLTWDRFERRVATDVLSLNPQSIRTVSLQGDDRAAREKISLDHEASGMAGTGKLNWILYRQRAETGQDTAEQRANTTAQCLSAAGSVNCLREAQFRFEQHETGVTLIAQRVFGTETTHQVVTGVEAVRTRTEEVRDGRQTNLNTGAITNVVGTDVFPTRDFPLSRTDRIGVFAQDSVTLGALAIIPALRYDHFRIDPESDAIFATGNPGRPVTPLSDNALSPKLGALWKVNAETTVTGQLAAGFRAPPYYDVNIGLSNLPLGYTVIPNPDLKPEHSAGFEAGVRGKHAQFDYSITAYSTRYRDLIVSRAPLPCPADPRCVPGAPITFQSQNVTRARIQGVEARAEKRLARNWAMRLAAAWNEGDDLSRNVPLNSIDPARLAAGIVWNDSAAQYGAGIHFAHALKKAHIDRSAGVLFETPAYTSVDLTGHIKLAKRVSVNAGIFNLLDRKYWLWSDVRGIVNPGSSVDRYTQPGRNAGILVKIDL
jgi:hemoglobin/transferrin/lactoferrin receptor protein